VEEAAIGHFKLVSRKSVSTANNWTSNLPNSK